MKNKFILIIGIVFLSIAILNSNAYATEIKKGEYSKRYQEWLKLSDEEKEKTILPLPVNIRGRSSNNIKTRFSNLVKSISIPSEYDLRKHINIDVENQANTGSCWAFSANKSLETYIAINDNEDTDFSERHV